MLNPEAGGGGNAMQDFWELECEVSGGWKGLGYLCYCSKCSGMRVTNGKQSFIICAQNNHFLYTSSKSKGLSLLDVYMHACLGLLGFFCFQLQYIVPNMYFFDKQLSLGH